MLAGFETAHGDILLDGVSINNIAPQARHWYGFQNYALFPHMSVAENLSFPLEVRKMGKADREADFAGADMVEMGSFAVVAWPSFPVGSNSELHLPERWSSNQAGADG